MKRIILTILPALLFIASFTACGFDNYDEPKSLLSGKVVYQGEALQVRGTGEKVRLQLYQYGYPNLVPIDVFVGQDGSFSAMLFDGEYKMVTRNNNGPWSTPRDSVTVVVKGNTVQNMEVTPYFTISNANMQVSGDNVTATFTVNKIVQSSEIEKFVLLLNKTQFVDDERNVQDPVVYKDNLTTGAQSYTFAITAGAKQQRALFGRICVWTKGADQGIYSPVFQIK